MSFKNNVFFCQQCNIPLINNSCERCHNISTTKFPLKSSPVFQEELDMLSDVTGYPLSMFGSLNLWTANRYYYFKGQKVFKLIGGNMVSPPRIEWLKDEKRIFKEIKNAELKTDGEIKSTIKEEICANFMELEAYKNQYLVLICFFLTLCQTPLFYFVLYGPLI